MQSSSYAIVSGWQLDSNDPSHIQQAQGFRLPVWLCRRGSNGRTAGQQCLGGQPVAVAVWARQAPPGRPDHRRDLRKEGCCQQCTAQACSSDSSSWQGESSLIRSTWCCLIVCTSMYEYVQVHTRMYEYVRVCISIIRGCKYSWSAHISLSFLAPTK